MQVDVALVNVVSYWLTLWWLINILKVIKPLTEPLYVK